MTPVAKSPPRVMLVAPRGEPGLLGSYGRALEHMGADVRYWDEHAAIGRVVRLGRIGKRFNAFVPIAPWEARANRQFAVAARAERPHAIVIAGSSRIDAGVLAQVRAALPDVRLVLVWSDTLVNLRQPTLAALPLYDLVATYSERSLESFKKLGARNVRWVPFAADPYLFPADVSMTAEQERKLACDVVFVGNPRPERERAVLALLERGMDVKVWGTSDWVRRTTDRARARRYWQGSPVFGADFVRANRCARLALNVIDDTNYPAANMRFFETLACRTPSLVSSCPEMEGVFPEGVGVAYFHGEEELLSKASDLIHDGDRRRRMADEGHTRVLAQHTYEHRARQVLAEIGLGLGPAKDMQ
jgi:spore maturation protein CgeB